MILKYFGPLGAASMLLFAIGCGGGNTSLSSSNHAVGVYVVQNGTGSGNSVLELPAGAQGSVAPSNSVTVPSQTTYDAVAIDTSGNLYVSASVVTAPPFLNEILVYAPAATGGATPIRTLTGLPGLATSIAVDATGAVYALSGSSTQAGTTLSVFAPGATGNAAPIRQISGPLTQLDSASAIAVDAAQNIYVANTAGNDVLVFSSTANGNAAPTGILAGATTLIGVPTGVAVDSAGDIYVSSFNQPSNSSLLLEFAPAATGNVAPTRTLTSLATDTLYGLAVDSADYLFVYTVVPTSSTVIPTSSQLQVSVFSPGATSGSAPSQTITSSTWTAPTAPSSINGQIAVQ